MIEKISSLQNYFENNSLEKYASITKIAIELVNKTDGTLSIKDIVEIEQLAFGVAFEHTENSLSSQVDDAMNNNEIDDFIYENQSIFREVIADKIPGKYLSALTDSVISSFLESAKRGRQLSLDITEEEAKNIDQEESKGFFGSIKEAVTNKLNKLMYEAYSEAKKKAAMYILNTPISQLEERIDENMIKSILYQLSSEDLEEGDEFVIFGSKDAYLLLGLGDVGDGEIEAEIYDMSGDKSSPSYMESMKPLFLEALKYSHSKGASSLTFTARESTSHALLSSQLLDERRRKSFLSEKNADSEKVYHHEKIESIDVERYPRFLQTKESDFAKNLIDLFNGICKEIRTPKYFKEKARMLRDDMKNFPEKYIGKDLEKAELRLSSYESRSLSMDRINKMIQRYKFSGEDSYCETMSIEEICSKFSEVEPRVVDIQNNSDFSTKSEAYIKELKDLILKFLRENKDEHYGLEDYFEYTIELS